METNALPKLNKTKSLADIINEICTSSNSLESQVRLLVDQLTHFHDETIKLTRKLIRSNLKNDLNKNKLQDFENQVARLRLKLKSASRRNKLKTQTKVG